MLEYVLVRSGTKSKVDYVNILQEVFFKTDYDGLMKDMKVLFSKEMPTELYTIYLDGKPMGISGLYWGDEEGICWLNWYGILDEFRGSGYGALIHEETLRRAKESGFKGIRLWTEDDCAVAITYLYDKKYELKEKIGTSSLYSHSFTDEPMKPYGRVPFGQVD